MMRSYTIRLKPTKAQSASLVALLGHLCELYNAALGERRDAWKVCQKSISYYDQQAELTQLRALDTESASFPACIQRDPLRRINQAMEDFFRRVKNGQNPGYPRFRAGSRYDSFTVPAYNFRIANNAVTITKLGSFRLKTRCRIRGTPRILHVRRIGNKWNAVVTCEIGAAPEKVPVAKAVGIDVGLTTLATLSDGAEIENPRWTGGEAERLEKANRSLASKKRGSKNRAKARERLRRVHQRIQGMRRAYLHDVSRYLVSNYDLIAFEKLNIRGMVRSNLAKSIMDAAWGELIWQLTYKAENAGKYAIAVNPKGTTQTCSGCGAIVKKTLSQRQHSCPGCGLELGRDENAARNILALGESAIQGGMKCQ